VTDTLKDGGRVSTIVTSWVAVLVLPLASLAVHVTVVVPSGNAAGASLVTWREPSHTSAADGRPRSGDVPAGETHSAVTSGGATIEGAIVSRTATATPHVLVAVPSLTASVTGNSPGPGKCTAGIGPVAVSSEKAPVHANVKGPHSASDEPPPSSATSVAAPAHSATYGPPASQTGG
jgi:hypothetical protein